jgi:hypothetical protein
MKVSKILHVERCCEFAFHTADFIRSAPVMIKSSTYSRMHIGPSRVFQTNNEESTFDVLKLFLRSCCVIFVFHARGACFSP